jgi:hypothetical protein
MSLAPAKTIHDFVPCPCAPHHYQSLDHGIGHPRSLYVRPPYAPLRALRCSRESLGGFFTCRLYPGSAPSVTA